MKFVSSVELREPSIGSSVASHQSLYMRGRDNLSMIYPLHLFDGLLLAMNPPYVEKEIVSAVLMKV